MSRERMFRSGDESNILSVIYGEPYELEGNGDTDDVSLKPFFCRIGSKFLLRNLILPLIPPHTTYVEPFAGGGAIFFAKPKAEKTVLNDLDKETAANFRLLQHAPTDLDAYPEATTVEGHKRIFNMTPKTNADKIAVSLVKNCDGFYGTPVLQAKAIVKTPSIHRKAKKIEEYKEKLNGVRITSEDYAKVIKDNDGPNTFFFIDPPYEDTSKTFGYAEHEGFDFERLVTVLSHIKGKFLMTMNDSPSIQKLFSKFYQRRFKAKSNISSSSKTGYTRYELFISNYKLP